MAFLKNLNVGALKEALETGVKAAQESAAGIQQSVANINIDDIARNAQGAIETAKDAAADGKATIEKAVANATQKSAEEPEEPTFKELVSLLWCLAYADGTISDEERKALCDLSNSLDESYETYATDIEQDCVARLDESSKEFGQQNAAKIEAQKIVESIDLTPTEAKLLCWNLLALANSDGIDAKELDLIRFIGEKANIEQSTFEELRNYSDAIIEIDRALEQLKSSGRSYSVIEPLVNEYEKREQTIIEAAQSLIADR